MRLPAPLGHRGAVILSRLGVQGCGRPGVGEHGLEQLGLARRSAAGEPLGEVLVVLGLHHPQRVEDLEVRPPIGTVRPPAAWNSATVAVVVGPPGHGLFRSR